MKKRERTQTWVNPEHKVRKQTILDPLRKAYDNFDPRCLFVTGASDEFCGKETSRNHTIPESQILKTLSDPNDGKVGEILWSFGKTVDLIIGTSESNPIDLFDAENYEPMWVGTGSASCGRFACESHDQAFQLIDSASPDFADTRVAFLSIYRISLYSLYLLKRTRHAIALVDREVNLVRNGTGIQKAEWYKLNVSLEQLLPCLEDKVKALGRIWFALENTGNIDDHLIASQAVQFRSKLAFAAVVSYGNGSVATVSPAQGNLHEMRIAGLVEDAEIDTELTARLVEASAGSMQNLNFGVNIIGQLGSLYTENKIISGRQYLVVIDISPVSYRELCNSERNTIKELVKNFARPELMAQIFKNR